MMLPLLFSAEEGALPPPFSPTFGLFIWTFVVFIPFLFLLSKFVFPVIVKATADREAAITKQLADAQRVHIVFCGHDRANHDQGADDNPTACDHRERFRFELQLGWWRRVDHDGVPPRK